MLELGDVQPHGRDLLKQQRRVLHQPRTWHRAQYLPRGTSYSPTTNIIRLRWRGWRWAPSLLTTFPYLLPAPVLVLPRGKSHPTPPAPIPTGPGNPQPGQLSTSLLFFCAQESPWGAGKEERAIRSFGG